MDEEKSLFVSSCSRRDLARRRGGRSRIAASSLTVPGLVALSCVLAVMVVLLAVGHGAL